MATNPLFENLQRIMRMQNMFSGQASPFVPEQFNADSEDYGVPSMQDLYTPETSATNRFNELLSAFPVRQKPSMLRKIGAGIVGGFLGPKAGMEAIDAPFRMQVEDWKTKMGPTASAMTQERLRNANERQLAYQTVSTRLREEAQEAKARNDTRRSDIAQQRANVYQMKSLKPNLKFNFTGPKVIVTDPETGKIETTDIDTGNLSDADKLALGQEHALERIEAGGEQARKTEGVRQEGREGIAETRGWSVANVTDPDTGKTRSVRINAITGEVKEMPTVGGTVARPSGAAGRPEAPTQTRVRTANRANQVKREHPEWSKWIVIEGNNVTVRPPAAGMFGRGPDEATYKKIISAIDQTEATSGRGAAPPKTDTGKLPEGKIKVTNPSGKVVMIDMKDWPAAEKQGYKKAY